MADSLKDFEAHLLGRGRFAGPIDCRDAEDVAASSETLKRDFGRVRKSILIAADLRCDGFHRRGDHRPIVAQDLHLNSNVRRAVRLRAGCVVNKDETSQK